MFPAFVFAFVAVCAPQDVRRSPATANAAICLFITVKIKGKSRAQLKQKSKEKQSKFTYPFAKKQIFHTLHSCRGVAQLASAHAWGA